VTTWKAHVDWRGVGDDELHDALDEDRAAFPWIAFTEARFQGDMGIGIDITSDDPDALARYMDAEGLAGDIVEVRPPVAGALASCEHAECMRVLNVAALLTAADGPEIESVGRFADVSASVAELKPFSLDCDVHMAVVYFRDAATGDWFILPVSRVTDPRLLAQLEAAREVKQDGSAC
jgi:hypothetical protein